MLICKAGMRKIGMCALLAACIAVLPLRAQQLAAQTSSVIGNWTEPTGSVLHVDRCADQICLWVIALSKQAAAPTDIYNPDPALRGRQLCGLRIGSGFIPHDATHAIDGTIYDPKSGRTYHGQLTAQGATLDLRGYIGIPLFGRSQTWTRATGQVKSCAAPGN
jgi:uncharacterized protein (DUF2147 family)